MRAMQEKSEKILKKSFTLVANATILRAHPMRGCVLTHIILCDENSSIEKR